MRLIRAKFERWLKAKPAEAIVGESRECHSCPLALFYLEASRCEVVIATSRSDGSYVIDRGYGDRRLPYWAQRFIFLVDSGSDTNITAGRAIAVMAEIKR